MIPYQTVKPNRQLPQPGTQLSLISKLLIGFASLKKGSEMQLKLQFYQSFLQFLKVVSLSLVHQNRLSDKLKSGISVKQLTRIERSFFEMLFQYNVVEKTGDSYFLHNEYRNWTLQEWEAIHALVHQTTKEHVIPTRLKRLGTQFLFVIELIQLYRNKAEIFNYINHPEHWQTLISQGKLDYEVRLSETLLGLKNLQLPHKIKSPFDDDYYTESGRNAFNNFTKNRFQECVQIIQQQHPIRTVLDVGCGYGNYIEALQEQLSNAEIYGIELQQKVYFETIKRFEQASNIHLFNQNIFDFKTPVKFDLVLFNYVLFYFSNEDKHKLFQQLHQQLSDHGSILICQYYSSIETLKTTLAKEQGDGSSAKQIEQFFGNKILYANALWNESSDAFVQSENWEEFEEILQQNRFKIVSLTNADKFYYSLFVEIKKI